MSPETVYAVFGTKRELLNAVVQAAATGVTEGGAVVEADLLDRVRAEPDQWRRFEMMAEATRDTLRRVGPLDEVVRAAAVGDPEIAALRRSTGHSASPMSGSSSGCWPRPGRSGCPSGRPPT